MPKELHCTIPEIRGVRLPALQTLSGMGGTRIVSLFLVAGPTKQNQEECLRDYIFIQIPYHGRLALNLSS